MEHPWNNIELVFKREMALDNENDGCVFIITYKYEPVG